MDATNPDFSCQVLFAPERNMEEKVSKQLEISLNLERKRAKYTVEELWKQIPGTNKPLLC